MIGQQSQVWLGKMLMIERQTEREDIIYIERMLVEKDFLMPVFKFLLVGVKHSQ